MKDLTPLKSSLDPIEIASRDEITALQLERLKWSLAHAYNNVPHDHLLGQQPKDVERSSELQYLLEKQAGEDLGTNFDQHANRVKKLREEGGFREMLPRHKWQRTTMPQYSSTVHEVKSFIG